MNPDTPDARRPDPPHPGLADLLACWHGETAPDPAVAAGWIERLRSDAELRRQFAAEIHLAGLTRAVQAGEPRWLRLGERIGFRDAEPSADEASVLEKFEDRIMGHLDMAFPSKHRLRRAGTPPWLAAAAGVALGMFFTSVVFAFVVPAMEKQWTILETDFENIPSPEPTGVPRSFGAWSGDFSELATAQHGVTPRSGATMWRFLRADNAVGRRAPFSYVGEAIHAIDLRPLRAAGMPPGSQIEICAWFAQGAVSPGSRFHWNIKAAAFEGAVAEAPERWLRWSESSAILAQREVAADEEPGRWQRLSVTMLFPDNADYLVFECAVVQREPVISTGVAEFPAHYVDDVRVRIIPPVRDGLGTE